MDYTNWPTDGSGAVWVGVGFGIEYDDFVTCVFYYTGPENGDTDVWECTDSYGENM